MSWRSSTLLVIFHIFCQSLCPGICGYSCHKEAEFVAVNQDGLPVIDPIGIVTTSTRFLCATECLSVQGCSSFAFFTTLSQDNCKLSSNILGVSVSGGTEAQIYKTLSSSKSGCASRPRQSGGTCEDICAEPYYLCHCPPASQGQQCEWDLTCMKADWWDSFESEGRSECSGTRNYLTGLVRNDCSGLGCIEEANCCPVPQAFSLEPRTCYQGLWHSSFGTDAWNTCDNGHFLVGFYRSGGSQDLEWLEEGVCCKPVGYPSTHTDCYEEDIMLSFD